MLKEILRGVQRARRRLGVFQIEASTYSPLESAIHPRSAFPEEWEFRKMSPATFEKIAVHFPLVQRVTFSGWGDPLENEKIIPMLDLAREAGCLAGMTTCCLGMEEGFSDRLIESELDFLVISLDLEKALGQSLARGGDAAPILEAAADLARRKKERRRGKPSLKLSFPMTRLNLRELPDIVPIAAEAGADGVVFRNLDYLPGERWNILRAFHHESPTPAFQETVGEILKAGEKAKIYVEVAPLKAEEIPVCEADPPNRIFFSADGSVAPCPYLCLPKKGNIPRIFLNRGAQVPRVTFGNVNDEDFADIWAKTEYVDFRTIFAERKAAAREHAARMLDPASQAGSTPAAGSHEAPPLPEVCRTCYKAYGI